MQFPTHDHKGNRKSLVCYPNKKKNVCGGLFMAVHPGNWAFGSSWTWILWRFTHSLTAEPFGSCCYSPTNTPFKMNISAGNCLLPRFACRRVWLTALCNVTQFVCNYSGSVVNTFPLLSIIYRNIASQSITYASIPPCIHTYATLPPWQASIRNLVTHPRSTRRTVGETSTLICIG